MVNKVSSQFDAIVIGGGPAGSAFSITAARAGLKVVLFEQTPEAGHKVCGEFLSSETQNLLSVLGVDLNRLNAPNQSTLRLVNRERFLDTELPFNGRSQSRRILDELLLQEASNSGVVIERGQQVTHLSTDKQKCCSTITLAGGSKITAPFIALAAGASTVRGIESRSISNLVGYKIMLSLNSAGTTELCDRVQLMGYDGGYQGMLLVEGQMASLAWIMRSDQAKSLGNKWNLHREFLSSRSELVGDMLKDSSTDWEKPLTVSGLQFGFLRKNMIAQNVYPVGRQMAIIPSFTGDGLAIALATGIYAAQVIADGNPAASYQNQMRRFLGHQFRWAKAVHPMFLNSWTRKTGLAVATRFPSIVRYVTHATRLANLPEVRN